MKRMPDFSSGIQSVDVVYVLINIDDITPLADAMNTNV